LIVTTGAAPDLPAPAAGHIAASQPVSQLMTEEAKDVRTK
jgi:hypothetical protein